MLYVYIPYELQYIVHLSGRRLVISDHFSDPLDVSSEDFCSSSWSVTASTGLPSSFVGGLLRRMNQNTLGSPPVCYCSANGRLCRTKEQRCAFLSIFLYGLHIDDHTSGKICCYINIRRWWVARAFMTPAFSLSPSQELDQRSVSP
jgi:hypothetical protein